MQFASAIVYKIQYTIIDMAKKLKKVEIPIDRRETFVSLQKNFADSDISVEEKLRLLYELQQTDIEIDKIIRLRGDLPFEVEELEAEYAAMQGKYNAAESVIEGLTSSILKNKQELVDLDTSISKYQKQLENISNSREYDSICKELENQRILRDIAEKHINEAKIAISEKKEELIEIKEKIEYLGKDLSDKKQELINIVGTTSDEENRLKSKRDACAEKLDTRTISAYERIKNSVNNHLAVVSVYNGDSCGGCFNSVIPQRLIEIASNKKLIICEHCGRIIVNPDIDSTK